MIKKSISVILSLVVIVIFFNIILTNNYRDLDVKVTELKQYIHPITSIDIKDSINTDLYFLSDILRDKKVVFLGEQKHTDGTTFEAKARLIRYLHENLDFNVVLYEAGLYDMWLLNTQFHDQTYNLKPELIPSLGLYNFWWNNKESLPLWEYYKNHKDSIILGGFDIQTTGFINSQFRYQILDEYLETKNIDLNKYHNISNFQDQLFSPSNNYTIRNIDTDRGNSILDELDSLYNQLYCKKNTEIDEIHLRYIKGLRNRYKSLREFRPGSLESMHIRDSLMAENLIWLIDSVYNNQKIIVWTANIHSFYDGQDLVDTNYQYKPLGNYIKDKYNTESYMLAFTSYGTKNKKDDIKDKASNNSLEYIFHQTGQKYSFINTSDIPRDSYLKKSNISVINQGLNQNAQWLNMIDGLFYIDIISNVTQNIYDLDNNK